MEIQDKNLDDRKKLSYIGEKLAHLKQKLKNETASTVRDGERLLDVLLHRVAIQIDEIVDNGVKGGILSQVHTARLRTSAIGIRDVLALRKQEQRCAELGGSSVGRS